MMAGRPGPAAPGLARPLVMVLAILLATAVLHLFGPQPWKAHAEVALVLLVVPLAGMFRSQHKQNLGLLESRANLAALIESTQDLIWSVDLEFRMLTFNTALKEHFRSNYGTEPRVGLTALDFLPPERAARWPGLYARALQEGACQVEYGLPDGRTLELAFHPIRRGHETLGVSVFGKDISERKRAEQEILTLKSHLANVIDSMPVMLAGVTPDGAVTHWNSHAEGVTGIAAAAALGRPLASLLPEFEPWLGPMLAELFSTGRSVATEKVLVERAGGQAVYDLMLYPLAADRVEGAVLRIEDVTGRTRIQDLMVQTEKMMSMGGLAAGMAHEINNPLGIISQAAQNLERRLSPDLPVNRTVAEGLGLDLEGFQAYFDQRRIPDFLASIQDAVARATRIVADLRELTQRPDARRAPAALDAVVHRALELAANDYDLKKKFNFKAIGIQCQFEPGLPPVPMVVAEVEQVVLNLVRNAAQAMSDNPPERTPRLEIRLRREASHAVLELEDNGPGMTDAVRRRIFEPFFTTREAGMGTGLGLAVAYMIITQNHKGLLEARSARGRGSCFTIRLPLAPESASEHEGEPNESP